MYPGELSLSVCRGADIADVSYQFTSSIFGLFSPSQQFVVFTAGNNNLSYVDIQILQRTTVLDICYARNEVLPVQGPTRPHFNGSRPCFARASSRDALTV